MWARGAAIRPVPKYAIVDRAVLHRIEAELAEEPSPHADLASNQFGAFERAQPALAEHIAQVLTRRLDATAISLGYFLTLSLWLAFHRSFGARLGTVTRDAVRAQQSALELEQRLRAEKAEEALELEDILQQEQPAILAFVHLHVEVALDPESDNEGDVDLDDVHLVYEAILVLTLALSHAVAPPDATTGGNPEILA